VRWKLVAIYVFLILFSMQLVGLYFIRSLNQYFLGNFNDSLGTSAKTLATAFSNAHEHGKLPDSPELRELVKYSVPNSLIYVLDRNGIIVDTSDNSALIGEKRVQSEVTRALLDKSVQTAIWVDPTNKKRYTFLAAPILNHAQVPIGAVDILAPMDNLYNTINSIENIFVTGTIVALILTILLGIPLARTITGPIAEVTARAREMAKGNFNQLVEVKSKDEIGQLGLTFNYLAQQLKTALHEKEQEKTKLEVVLENMGEGVVAIDGEEAVILVNPMARTMLGYATDRIAPADLPEEIRSLITQQSEDARGLPMEKRFDGPNGQKLLGYVVSFMMDESSKRGNVVVIRDVTEQERMEQARRNFVADVSHEIRTPLTTIRSYVEALTEGAIHDDQVARRFLNVIASESVRMTRLVTELLQLSRLDAKKEQWDPTEELIPDILIDVANRFHIQAKQRSMDFTVDIASDIPCIRVDRDKIDQVLDNIVSNAFKYTPDEGTVQIRAAYELPQVKIVIADSGVGIPVHDIPHVFERFYRVDKARSRKSGGAGLGLAIAKEIVERHGGDIAIESIAERGTTVTISLPIAGGCSE